MSTWVKFQQCRLSSQAIQLSDPFLNHSELPSLEFDSYAYAVMLRDCIRNGDITTGMRLQCEILKRGTCLDLFANNILLNMYVKSGLFPSAYKLFEEMPKRNTISFVTLIQGLSQSERFIEAMELFSRLHREGHELNPFVFTAVLKLLVRMGWSEFCRNLHASIYKLGYESHAFVGTALIDSYSVCGYVDFATDVFEGITDKDMVSWTGMLACYAENDCFEDALDFFYQMRMIGFKPNNFTFASVLKACLGLDALNPGKAVHGYVLKSNFGGDNFVGLALLELYTKSGDLDDAHHVFEEMPKNDVVPWSFMISRYAQSGYGEEALYLFSQMMQAFIVPNQYTYTSVLQSCAAIKGLHTGKQVHCHVIKVGFDSDVFVSNALIGVYAKCGKIEKSLKLFAESPNRNDVSWNTIIVGHVQLGDGKTALSLFSSMLKELVKATEVTYSTSFSACASMATLEPGLQIHSLTIKSLYDKDIAVGNAMVDMYARCGSIKDARLVFDRLNQRDEVSWNAMIFGYSMHGLSLEALKVFEQMKKTKCKPNNLTFLGVLSACSNAGLLDQGQAYFKSMTKNYGIEPCMEHYTCMVRILGRSGQFNEAMNLIDEIPFEPSIMVWRALLGACVIHNNVELGRISAQHVLEMEPQDETAHVLISNIYASNKMWEDVAFIRKNMKNKGVKKEPGLSWIEYQGAVHFFAVGNNSHPDLKLINGMLEWLKMKTQSAGYAPNHNAVLHDMEDDEKVRRLWVHSERLALAYGLIRVPSGSPIRIIKNLRICTDCHAAMKLISDVVKRDIIVRDMNRFHHFQEGVCSCGDYW